jgi:hypothetical protein
MEKIDYVPWAVSGACLTGSLLLPSYTKEIWITGVAVLLPLVWSEIRKPVNYESLEFDAVGFIFRGRAKAVVAAKWSEVREVFYCRTFNDFANQTDTEWQFRLSSDKQVTVLVEWPQSSKFEDAVIANLKQVSAVAVGEAIAQRGEGRWSVVHETVAHA